MTESMFEVSLNGETISIPLAKARELCPAEVEAMERAGERVSALATAGRADSRALADAAAALGDRLRELLDALARQVGRQ
jgi:hypothetical protein